jgi:hypothetical protein
MSSLEYRKEYYLKNREKIINYTKMYVKKHRLDIDIEKKRADRKMLKGYRVNTFIQEYYKQHYELITWEKAEKIMKKEFDEEE